MADLYRHDEVQEILHIAIARQTRAGELTRQQLLEIAEDLGLSERDIRLAEEEWRSRDTEGKDRQAFLQYRRTQFKQHVAKYLIVNAFLFVLSFVLTGIWIWEGLIFFSLLWGMFLALDGWSALQSEGDTFERRYNKWRRDRWLRRSMGKVIGRWFKAT